MYIKLSTAAFYACDNVLLQNFLVLFKILEHTT